MLASVCVFQDKCGGKFHCLDCLTSGLKWNMYLERQFKGHVLLPSQRLALKSVVSPTLKVLVGP